MHGQSGYQTIEKKTPVTAMTGVGRKVMLCRSNRIIVDDHARMGFDWRKTSGIDALAVLPDLRGTTAIEGSVQQTAPWRESIAPMIGRFGFRMIAVI